MEKKCRVCQLNKALLVPLYRKDDETEYILCMLNSIVESNVSKPIIRSQMINDNQMIYVKSEILI